MAQYLSLPETACGCRGGPESNTEFLLIFGDTPQPQTASLIGQCACPPSPCVLTPLPIIPAIHYTVIEQLPRGWSWRGEANPNGQVGRQVVEDHRMTKETAASRSMGEAGLQEDQAVSRCHPSSDHCSFPKPRLQTGVPTRGTFVLASTAPLTLR